MFEQSSVTGRKKSRCGEKKKRDVDDFTKGSIRQISYRSLGLLAFWTLSIIRYSKRQNPLKSTQAIGYFPKVRFMLFNSKCNLKKRVI
jgi:hypothetical protein